jgi:zinc protease
VPSLTANVIQEPITEGPEQTLSWTDPIPLDPSIVSGVLPSGLKYYVKPSETPKNRVFLKLVVRTGSVHEEPHELGVAHLLEHLAFRRTLHFSDNEITSYLQSIGCRAGSLR